MNIEIFDCNKAESIDDPTIKFQDLTTFHRKLSHLIKTAKYHVIKLLKIKLKKLENKITKKNEDCKENSKIKHKKEEIDFLNEANLDKLAKRIFANKFSENDLEKLGDKMSLEDRIVVRLFNFNLIKNEITKFRSEHPDWEKLAEDLFYKNTGGRVKINKSKKVGSIPLANGIKESEASNDLKDEKTEQILMVPVLEANKKKKESEKRFKEVEKKREIEKQKAAEIKQEEEEANKALEISEEAICEFIKNEDDLDEWEKNINEDEEEEINLMTPLDGGENIEKKKKPRGGKKVNHKSERTQGQKWKGTTNQFGAKKVKISDE